MYIIRVCVILAVLVLIFCENFLECSYSLADGECMRDKSFEWTELLNKPLRDNYWAVKKVDKWGRAWSDYMLIMHGFEFDFLQIGAQICMLKYGWKTYTLLFTMIMFYGVRGVIQANFLLSRTEVGYIYYDPGWPNITSPYLDILDFFYSGHIGNTFIYTFEFYKNGHKNISYIGVLIWLSMFPLLILTRVHYWIDIITGILVAHWCCMMSEQVSYILDVKYLGFSGKERNQHAYLPCSKCGYSNDNYCLGIDQDEATFLKKTYRIR